MKKDGTESITAQPIKKRLPIALEAILMMFLPIIGFSLFSYLTYPLRPHCSIGSGFLGCTPMCEATSFFENGSPAGYKVTPCFHDDPSGMQYFSYKQPIPYYSIFLFPLILGFYLLKAEKFYNLCLRILFYPYFLFKENRKNKKFISRLIVILLILPLAIEWIIGYGAVITTILGIGLFG